MFHTGAIVATALDSILLPLQTKNGFLLMNDLAKQLNAECRKAVGISLSGERGMSRATRRWRSRRADADERKSPQGSSFLACL